MSGKGLRKIILQLHVMCYMSKYINILLYLKNIYPVNISKHNSHLEQSILLMIPNRGRCHFIPLKVYLHHRNMIVIFIVWVVFFSFKEKTNLNHIKKYVKIKIIHNKSRLTYSLCIFYVYYLDIIWYWRKACYIQRWRLIEKVLWILKRAQNEDN